MLIFIDESGIHKKVDHSSFVLAYVALENYEQASRAIAQTEKNLGINYFHWSNFGSKRGWKTREKFIESVSGLPFVFKYTITKNPVLPEEGLFNAISHFFREKNIKKIVIDGSQPKWYERQIKRSLRSRNISIKKLKISRDTSEPLLRLADALAGLIRSYHDSPTGVAKELYELLQAKNKITAHLTVDGQEVPRV
jgi:hypothetical protein